MASKKKVWITGIEGFVGSHLADLLVSADLYEVYGSYFSESDLQNIGHLIDRLTVCRVDIRKENEIQACLNRIRPDFICHLAAISSVKLSFQDPATLFEVNVKGTLHVLEAISRVYTLNRPRIIIPSSCEVYGKSVDGRPFQEDAPFSPVNPYGASKAAVEIYAIYYAHHYSLPVCRIRLFNLIGPGQSKGFVVPDFAEQIVVLEAQGKGGVIKVGNLDVRRDLIDVRDGARAIQLLMEEGKTNDVFNVCSGVPLRLEDILNTLIGFSNIPIDVTVDKDLIRPVDNPIMVGSYDKIRKCCGWKPTIPIDVTLQDCLEYYRRHSNP